MPPTAFYVEILFCLSYIIIVIFNDAYIYYASYKHKEGRGI